MQIREFSAFLRPEYEDSVQVDSQEEQIEEDVVGEEVMVVAIEGPTHDGSLFSAGDDMIGGIRIVF